MGKRWGKSGVTWQTYKLETDAQDAAVSLHQVHGWFTEVIYMDTEVFPRAARRWLVVILDSNRRDGR